MKKKRMEPLTRQYLLGLKAQVDEETRVRHVQCYANSIYNQVKQTASNTPQTRFQQRVEPDNGNTSHHGYFNVRNSMPDILDKLQGLFPDSKVEFKTLSRGQDGKMYDIVDIDERMKPFIDTRFKQDFIVIDWS